MERFVESFEEFNSKNTYKQTPMVPDPNIIENTDIILEEVLAHLEHIAGDVKIKEVALVGSRILGRFTPDSDIDILVEYEGNIKENNLENVLFEEPLYYEDMKVDYITLQSGRYGPGISCIDTWLEQHKEYSGLEIHRVKL